MPVDSVYPRLEPLLAGVSKPIQYIGGGLCSTAKGRGGARGRGGPVYPPADEVGLAQPGGPIL